MDEIQQVIQFLERLIEKDVGEIVKILKETPRREAAVILARVSDANVSCFSADFRPVSPLLLSKRGVLNRFLVFLQQCHPIKQHPLLPTIPENQGTVFYLVSLEKWQRKSVNCTLIRMAVSADLCRQIS